MSAELIREAAAKMRTDAQAVTSGAQWTGSHYWIADYDPSDPSGQTAMQRLIGGMDAPDCDYYSSWHPDVALAVADWLDHEATRVELGLVSIPDAEHGHWQGPAMKVALTYLGRSS